VAGTDPVTQANQRIEQVTAELAALLRSDDSHMPECGCDTVMLEPGCFDTQARAVLAYLHGAGVLTWGQGHSPMPRPPEGAKEAYAVRIGAEFWHPIERTPDDIEHDVTRCHWVPGVLATAAGYDGEAITDQTRTFLDELSPQQVRMLHRMTWQLHHALEGLL
jgi:hypothetical protein